jgi:hypothetical protein
MKKVLLILVLIYSISLRGQYPVNATYVKLSDRLQFSDNSKMYKFDTTLMLATKPYSRTLVKDTASVLRSIINTKLTWSDTASNKPLATKAWVKANGGTGSMPIGFLNSNNKPWGSQKSYVSLDTSNTNPTGTQRVNLNGNLFLTKLNLGNVLGGTFDVALNIDNNKDIGYACNINNYNTGSPMLINLQGTTNSNKNFLLQYKDVDKFYVDSTGYVHSTGGIQKVSKIYTAANINAADTIELIASPGSGKYINIVTATASFKPGGVAFTSNKNPKLGYGNDFEMGFGFGVITANTEYQGQYSSLLAVIGSYKNKALNFVMSGTNTSGNGTIKLDILYTIEDY